MKRITVTDFTGGIQEARTPDDFDDNQWAILKGIVPRDRDTFESQWSAQQIGNIGSVQAVYPLSSQVGTFLVAITTNGQIWWAKAPAETASFATANAVSWTQLTGTNATNRGWRSRETTAGDQPAITIQTNADYRFVTGLPFEVYKYAVQPVSGAANELNRDEMPDTTNDEGVSVGGVLPPRSIVSGVLIHSRRFYTNGVITPTSETQTAVVAYVDPNDNSGVGTVKGVTFPNVRRWPVYLASGSGFSGNYDPVEPATVGSALGFNTREFIQRYPYNPLTESITSRRRDSGTARLTFATNHDFKSGDKVTVNSSASSFNGLVTITGVPAANQIEYASAGSNVSPTATTGTVVLEYGFPKPHQIFHPYTWLDLNKTMLPGQGIIPRGNVGTMLGNLLMIGDIEWRSDAAITAKGETKISPTANTAPLGSIYAPFGLRDGNTEPHRGSFYYSEDDIDKFDPRSVVRASGTDTRIAGMHALDNRLIIVTTAGGENDGVISYTGNFSQLHSYDPRVAANPLAIKKQIIRGGIGVADRTPDSGGGHINQTCVWAELGNVCFIDRLGGIFVTNGEVCDRIDRTGPAQPPSASFEDHVASVGNHLIAWRDRRLLVFSILGSDGENFNGCWTELVPPVSISNKSSIKSMIGLSRSLYFVGNGNVWRFAVDAPAAERGTVNGNAITQTIATRTIGDLDADVRVNWFQVSVSFSTTATCNLTSVVVKAGPALQTNSPTPNPGSSQVVSYTAFSGSRSFTNGYYTVNFPAGIGPQPQISLTATFNGPAQFEAATFWYTGSAMKRGGPQ
jgi:hypothetical protein